MQFKYNAKNKTMKQFNPFYIEPEVSTILDDSQVLIINAFDIREGKSLTQYLRDFRMCKENMDNFMSYLWLTLNALDREEAAQIVRNEQRQLEKQTAMSFGDININTWVPVHRKK